MFNLDLDQFPENLKGACDSVLKTDDQLKAIAPKASITLATVNNANSTDPPQSKPSSPHQGEEANPVQVHLMCCGPSKLQPTFDAEIAKLENEITQASRDIQDNDVTLKQNVSTTNELAKYRTSLYKSLIQECEAVQELEEQLFRVKQSIHCPRNANMVIPKVNLQVTIENLTALDNRKNSLLNDKLYKDSLVSNCNEISKKIDSFTKDWKEMIPTLESIEKDLKEKQTTLRTIAIPAPQPKPQYHRHTPENKQLHRPSRSPDDEHSTQGHYHSRESKRQSRPCRCPHQTTKQSLKKSGNNNFPRASGADYPVSKSKNCDCPTGCNCEVDG